MPTCTVHPHPRPVTPSFRDDVRSPRFPSHYSHIQDQFRLPSRLQPSPKGKVAPQPPRSPHRLVRQRVNTPSPRPRVLASGLLVPLALSHPAGSLRLHPFTNPASTYPPQCPTRTSDPWRAPSPRTHRAQYDVRLLPTQSNPHLSPVILARPASIPPLPTLGLRVGDLAIQDYPRRRTLAWECLRHSSGRLSRHPLPPPHGCEEC